jgi:general secretion pathway protein E
MYGDRAQPAGPVISADTDSPAMNTASIDQSTSEWRGDIDPSMATSVSYQFAKRHGVLVAGIDDGHMQVLCAQEPQIDLVTELRRRLGHPLSIRRIEPGRFDSLLRQAYGRGQSEATQMVDDLGDDVDLARLAYEIPDATDLLEAADDAPIIKLINALLTQAIREGASDIHIEAFEQRSVVRFRVDGTLRDIVEPHRALHNAMVSRLKIMAKLDIAEKRLPQDGRISLRVAEHPVDVRVSTLPTRHGERVVLRLLDKQSARLDLGQLGMPEDIGKEFDDLIHSPHGIVLVTGPTGSGKTTTLYAGLSRLDRMELNILTVEDPIEYDLDGVGQMQVNTKIALSFAQGLRSILRQDPDVILVGEIRDFETAEIAVQASLTGHLVLSTLHTNTAIGAVTRLVDMGIEPFLIASSLLGVLSQRLVRRLCDNCKQATQPTEAERELLGLGASGREVELYRAIGCELCGFTGYRGRTGIFELFKIDNALRTMIHDGGAEGAMADHIRQSSPSLQASGFGKVLAGVTSLDEVLRVTRDE